MEIPRQVSPSKESAGRNVVGGEGTNCKVLRKEDIQGKAGLSGDILG